MIPKYENIKIRWTKKTEQIHMPILNSDSDPKNALLISTFKQASSKREIRRKELEDDLSRGLKSYAAARFILLSQLEHCAEQFSDITKRKAELHKTKSMNRILIAEALKSRIKSYAISKVSLAVKLYRFNQAKAVLEAKQAEYNNKERRSNTTTRRRK